jgi:hypothetical protein
MSQLVKAKRQTNFKYFKRFGGRRRKNVVSTRSCVNWALYGTSAIKSPSKLGSLWYECHKKPNLHTNFLNKLLFTD